MNMTRNVMVLLFCSGVLFITLMAGAGTPTSVVNSKHNLSGATTNAYRAASSPASGGTGEVCIFCHTPHAGNTEAPLWNRAAYDRPSGYTPYSSDVLTGLTYSSAEDPYDTGLAAAAVHAKTRVCLSCHDGTIALGSLVNMPSNISGYSEIQMAGDKYIQTSAQGFIGVDLSDDHPVSIAYVSGVDPELRLSLDDTLAPNVNLYQLNGGKVKKTKTSATNAYVECTSCHNPHDNQYGNFLVDSNESSKICRTCHDKNIGLSTNSAHDLSLIGYNGETIGSLKCMTCHFPHKAGGTGAYPNISPISAGSTLGRYLLSYPEENSCYNNPQNRWGQTTNPCHGTGSTEKDIQSLVVSKTYKHEVSKYTSLHEAYEAKIYGAGWLESGNAKWHIECADCHNSHTAGNTSHVASTPVPLSGAPMPKLGTASPLYGAGGVQVDTPPTWLGGTGNYTYLEPVGVVDKSKTATGVEYEFQVCLKCHSEFAWRGTGSVPTSASLGAVFTDQAVEFNLGNLSFHPVEGPLTTSAQGAYVNGWANTNQTMYCSDCHNNDFAPPQGPHGSGKPFILSAAFSYDNDYGASGGAAQPTSDICFTCHNVNVYDTTTQNDTLGVTGFKTSPGGINLHTQHAYLQRSGVPAVVTNPLPYRCIDCHIRIPHGWNARKAMVVFRGDGAPYEVGSGLIDGTSSLPTSGNYGTINSNCTTAAGCHRN